MQIFTAGLLVLKNKKLLLAFSNNKMAFYLPGGKIYNGEEMKQGLCREIKEELNINIIPGELTFYTHITAPAYGEANGIIMEQDCFLYELKETPNASAEIGVLEYFDRPTYLKQSNHVPGVLMVMEKLESVGLM